MPGTIKNHKHYYYIDVLRVLASFMVIFTHIFMYRVNVFPTRSMGWTLAVAGKAMTQFAVPCFFMISGAMLLSDGRQMSYGDFIKRRFGKVFLPFVIWTMVYYMYFGLVLYKEPVSLGGYVKSFLGQDISGHFWYMYALAVCYLLAPFMRKLVQSLKTVELEIFLIIIFGLGSFVPFVDEVLATFSSVNISLFELSKMGVYLSYMVLGYYLHTMPKDRIRKLFPASIGVLVCIFVYQILGTWLASGEKFDKTWLTITFAPLVLYAAAMFVFVRVRCMDRKEKECGNLSKWIGTLSGLSFTAYLVHMLILRTDQHFITNRMLRGYLDTPTKIAVIVVGELVGVVLLSYLLAAICKRIKWIGKYL